MCEALATSHIRYFLTNFLASKTGLAQSTVSTVLSSCKRHIQSCFVPTHQNTFPPIVNSEQCLST